MLWHRDDGHLAADREDARDRLAIDYQSSGPRSGAVVLAWMQVFLMPLRAVFG